MDIFVEVLEQGWLTISNSILDDKYYHKGVLVESITSETDQLISLYDYFLKYPQSDINVKDYVNYCMRDYDYTQILHSNFVKYNYNIGEQLAYQVLLSILRMDQNFHYENINFVNEKIIAPAIYFEFSTPFLYPDKLSEHKKYYNRYKDSIQIRDKDETDDILSPFLEQQTGLKIANKLRSNIGVIVEMFSQIVYKFINNLDKLIADLSSFKISDPDNFIDSLNSDYWQLGDALYKKKDPEQYFLLKSKIHLETINKEKIFELINNEILEFSQQMSKILKIYLVCYERGIRNLEYLTFDNIYNHLDIGNDSSIIEEDLNNRKFILSKNMLI